MPAGTAARQELEATLGQAATTAAVRVKLTLLSTPIPGTLFLDSAGAALRPTGTRRDAS